MKTSEIQKLLDSAYGMRKEIVPMLLGEPGIGKTQGVYAFAKSKGVKVVELYLSQMSPLEISGMTMPNEADHSMQVFDSKRLESLEDGDVLFLDELLQAPQQVLAACLTLIQERRMLSGKMLPDVFIVAAANPIDNMETRIPLSIRQRFMAINVMFDDYAWARHMQSMGILAKEEDVMAVKGMVKIGFNECTPRTLTKLCRWYFEAEDKKFTENAIGDMFSTLVSEKVKEISERSGNEVKVKLVKAVNEQQSAEPDPMKRVRLNEINETLMADDGRTDDERIARTVAKIFRNMDGFPMLAEAMKEIDISESMMQEAKMMVKEQEENDEAVHPA